MLKTASINVRTDPNVKMNAEKLFDSLGITLSDAINIFLRISIMEGGLPFAVRQKKYNMATEQAMDEARAIASGIIPAKKYNSAAEMFADLDNMAEDE